MRPMILMQLLITLLMLVSLAGCQSKNPAQGKEEVKKVSVVTTLFPLYDFARTISGDKAQVTLLLPPGVEAHNFEPKPADLISINKADIFVYTNARMEPWATKLLKGVASPALKVVDASVGTRTLPAREVHGDTHGHDQQGVEGGIDPHLWLDFKNAVIIVDSIVLALAEKDPANGAYYRERGNACKGELRKLDADFSAGLATCQKRTFLHGGHYAFGYLADRYGLTYRSAQAVNPDAEPTPATIAELLKLLKANGLEYVYAEELVSPRISEMLSREAGVKILMLHGAHNISKDDLAGGATFVSLMRKNLESLRTGLGCR